MSEKFVCTVDGMVFQTEEELITHVKKNYIAIQKNKNGVLSEAMQAFRQLLPNAALTGEEYRDKVIMHVLQGEAIEWHFRIGTPEISEFFGEHWFETVESAVAFYRDMIGMGNKIKGHLQQKYNAQNITIHQYWYDNNYGRLDKTIHYSFEVDEKKYQETYHYEPWEKHEAKIAGHFVTELEGDCVREGPRTYVNNIDVWDIIERAKKIKIEIIE